LSCLQEAGDLLSDRVALKCALWPPGLYACAMNSPVMMPEKAKIAEKYRSRKKKSKSLAWHQHCDPFPSRLKNDYPRLCGKRIGVLGALMRTAYLLWHRPRGSRRKQPFRWSISWPSECLGRGVQRGAQIRYASRAPGKSSVLVTDEPGRALPKVPSRREHRDQGIMRFETGGHPR